MIRHLKFLQLELRSNPSPSRIKKIKELMKYLENIMRLKKKGENK
jgi:hypothetical protein